MNLAVVDCGEREGGRHILTRVSVLEGDRIGCLFAARVGVFVSVEQKSLLQLVLFALVKALGEGSGRLLLLRGDAVRNLSCKALVLFLDVTIHLLLDLSFLLTLIFSELLVIHQLGVDVWVYWVIVKDSLLFDSFFERSNYFIQGLAVFIVFLALITHNLTNRDAEDTNKLAREALEDLVINSTSH